MEYRSKRDSVKSEIRRCKRETEITIANNSKSNPKEFSDIFLQKKPARRILVRWQTLEEGLQMTMIKCPRS